MDKNNVDKVLSLAEMLAAHKAGDVAALDFRALAMWMDFFVIGTVTSAAHLSGLQRHIKDFAAENALTFRHSSGGKPSSGAAMDGIIWDICELSGFCVDNINGGKDAACFPNGQFVEDKLYKRNCQGWQFRGGKDAACLPNGQFVEDKLYNQICQGGQICVIHLMSAQAREFYELERLWSGAELLHV